MGNFLDRLKAVPAAALALGITMLSGTNAEATNVSGACCVITYNSKPGCLFPDRETRELVCADTLILVDVECCDNKALTVITVTNNNTLCDKAEDTGRCLPPGAQYDSTDSRVCYASGLLGYGCPEDDYWWFEAGSGSPTTC